MKYVKWLVILLFFSLSTQAQALNIRMAVFTDQLPMIEKMTAEQTCPYIDPSLFGENQMLAEYLLVCNALKFRHNTLNIELVPYPVTKRIAAAVARHEVDISGLGIWKNEGEIANVLLSDPLLEEGQFTKGLYVLPENAEKIDWFDKQARSKLLVVSNMNWTNDWKALECTGLRRVHVDQYEQMFKMLALGRTDVLTMAFGSDPLLNREEFGIELLPIQGVKLVVRQSSHILVSSDVTRYINLLDDINAGLAHLRSQGLINKTYLDVGVTNPLVESWPSICDEQPSSTTTNSAQVDSQ